jgi:hypothetical protein
VKVCGAQSTWVETPQLLTRSGGAAHEEFFGNPGLANSGAFMEQPCKHEHEPICAFDLAERQAVALNPKTEVGAKTALNCRARIRIFQV